MTTWSEISDDPNSVAVLSSNQKTLDSSRQMQVENRTDYLVSLARGKKVLDIGVVEHSLDSVKSGRWLHRHLVESASSCVGLDVLENSVRALQAEGYDVRVHDLTTTPLDETFDLIVAGDVIEHVGGPQRLLEHARLSLAPGGRIVVTTPNPYMLHRAVHGLRGDFRDSADHVALFGPSHMLELGHRAGLRLDRWRGVRLKTPTHVRGRAIAGLRRLVASTLLSSDVNCDTLIYEFVARFE